MIYRAILICISIALIQIATAQVHADVVDFVLDASQSSASVSFGGSTDQSQTSGAGVLNLTPSTPPFGVAQVTEMNIVLDDAMSFSFLAGLVTGSTTAGDVMIDLVIPGAAGIVSANQFDQTGNILGLSGDVNIVDPLGLVGGNATVDLSTIAISPVDFNDLTLSRLGDVVTISGTYNISDNIDLGGASIAIIVTGNFVASGLVTVPEPSGLVALLSGFGLITARRRRSKS